VSLSELHADEGWLIVAERRSSQTEATATEKRRSMKTPMSRGSKWRMKATSSSNLKDLRNRFRYRC